MTSPVGRIYATALTLFTFFLTWARRLASVAVEDSRLARPASAGACSP